MMGDGIIALVFMVAGAVFITLLGTDGWLALGQWRRDRIRRRSKIKQPRRSWS